MNLDLIDYLTKLTIPPGGEMLTCEDLGSLDLTAIPDNHFHGALVQGTPTAEQATEILRVVRPGAHVLLIAPEDNPMGHRGAVTCEDAGFEVRDAIAWVRRGGAVLYTGKVKSKRERHGGTGGHNNSHPTLKPIKLMEQLLEDIPPDKVVADFFLGAGATGIAALRTGHDFVGIELEAESLRISDQRIRHHDAADAGWLRANIVSDHKEPEPEPEPLGLGDLFGWDDDEGGI